jgi:hypothetical protein
MTRKDYVAIARALRGSRYLVQPNRFQWSTTVKAIADTLAADNPRFDRTRFYAACASGTSSLTADLETMRELVA